jgi:iron complex transport system substrate-binding protein
VRIVSLLPSTTEILFGIGAGSEVVGVTHECDYPKEARGLPHLTSSAIPSASTPAEIDRHVRAGLHAGSSVYSLDADALARLEPDLIVTQELCEVCSVSYEQVASAVHRLRGDPRIVSLEPSSLEEVLGTIATLGELTHHAEGAERLVASLRARITALEDQVIKRHLVPRVLFLEWTDPLMSAGHWIPELVELAGGEPVLADPLRNSRRLAWDAIAAADPDAIVVAPCGLDLQKTHDAIVMLADAAQWRDLRAVRAGHVLAMDGNAYASRPGPRLVDTAEIMAEWIATAGNTARDTRKLPRGAACHVPQRF